MSRRFLYLALTISLVLFSSFFIYSSPTAAAASVSYSGLHVAGVNVVNALGLPVTLHGVDRSGGEFACVQGSGMWNGPMDQASISAMLTWKINAVRVPLNEDCWLGINGVGTGNYPDTGVSYQQGITNYVNMAIQNGLYVILDLHWTNAGTTLATNQQPMPDADHSPTFWTGVATTFKNNGNVIFDLFNEPFPGGGGPGSADWTCWLNGGTCNGMSYPAVGMQSLVNTVRATGANNLLMLGGLAWSNDLSQWLSHKPTDPANNLAASWHSYNFNSCNNQGCWDANIAPVGAQVPVIAGEIGENDCAHSYIDPLMAWMDSHSMSYIGWTWNSTNSGWGCGTGPALIVDYTGAPTQTFGQGYHDHLLALNPGPTVTPLPTYTSTPTFTPT